MMNQGKKLLSLAVFSALVIPLLFAGTASAIYVGDNAKPNGVTGGWDLPADKGFCVTGIKRDGTMIIDLSVGNNRNNCIAKVFPSYQTSAACLAADKAGANAEGSHFWSSACINPADNTGISLSGLDRTRFMCEQKGGVYRLACNSSWTAMGPAWSDAPVSPTTGGTDGFCYTSIRVAGYDNNTCPRPVAGSPGTGKLGYSWNTSDNTCRYAYGVVGPAAATINFKDGQAPPYATAGTVVNLTGLLQGQCLANGASFSNHTTAGGFGPDPVDGTVTIASPITQVRTGCLSCHNNTTQYNSMSGRWKSDYLKQGHKNMLRKVTPGQKWAGPDANGNIIPYTQAAVPSGAAAGDYQILDFTAGTATTTFWGTRELMYIFGDWMAPAPEGLDTVVWRADLNGARYNGTSTYSCAACHATGWSNGSAGICVVGSAAKTSTQAGTLAACTGLGGTWYPMSGAQSSYAWPADNSYLGTYKPAQPGASFPSHANSDNSINGITGRWDVDGITCNRCHQVSYDPTFPINDQGVNAAPGHTTHETDIFNGWACVKTCFGCHQSTPYVNNGTGNAGQNEVDLANPVALQVKNSGTGGAYLPEFNSHPIGNMFLNSPHGKFTGTMLPNNLGKFDIVEATAVNASAFVGKLCRSSTAVAGGSILETQVNGEPIKTLEECNVANGKTTNLDNNFGYWQDESGDEATGTFTGSCITCHNVHESLFVADAKEPIRRECTTCHNNNDEAKGSYPLAPKVNLANMRHPDGGETPAGQAATDGYEAKACEICHMPKATSAGFPMHLWRVNSSASYRTFPDNTQFTSNTKKVANTAPDGSYTPAVWVDVDYACGQCHGGSFGPAAVKFGAIYKSKAELAIKAANIHNDKPIASFTYGLAYPAIDTVNVYGSSSSCPSGTCNYSWAFGDGGTAMGATATHQYAAGGTYPITLTVQDSETLASASVTNNVNVFLADAAPVAHFTPTAGVQDNCAAIVVGRLASFTDSSTDDHLPLKSVKVSWGDGTMFSNGVSGGLFTHNYLRKGTFTITQMVTDSAGNTNKRVCTGVVVP